MTYSRSFESLPAPGSWADRALCKGRTDEFFLYGPGQVPRKLRELCAACPVQEDCLSYALEHNPIGIWAGTSWLERSRMTGRKGTHWPGKAS